MTHNNTALLLATAALCTGVAANAEVLSPDEALARARNTHQCKAVSASPAEYTLEYTARLAGQPTSYVFTTGNTGGFVILSADDLVTPVLGYSDESRFDPDNIPANLAWKLGEYSRQIQRARELAADNTGQSASAVLLDPNFPDIEPMIASKWGQDAPFNLFCPRDASGQLSVTGCVATAMAQVMNYYKYPQVGVGSDFAFMIGEGAYTVEMDFAEHPFNWTEMRDNYNIVFPQIPKTAREAVANLMYCCGVSANMMYSPEGSGTGSCEALKGLVNHFCYDKGSRLLLHYYFQPYEWACIVYNELRNRRPVYYAGGGHAFVCDGFSDGYFHMNWGWDGYYNGYFLLDLLDATGDGSLVFSTGDEQIIVGACPAVDGSKQAYEFHSLVDFFVKTSNKQLGKKFVITSRLHISDTEDYWYMNDSSADFVGTFGLNVISADGNVVYVAGDRKDIDFVIRADFTNSVLQSYKVSIPQDFPEGEYTVVPAFCPDGGDVTNINVHINYVQAYRMSVSNGYAYFEPIMPEYYNSLKLECCPLTDTANDDGLFEYYVSVANTGIEHRSCSIAAGLYPLGSKEFSAPVFSGEPVDIEIESGSSINLTYSASLGDAPSGEYMLYFYDSATLKRVSSGFYVSVAHDDDPDGIPTVDSANTIVKTEYFDMQGRPITHPASGIYIMRCTLSDGSTTTTKIAK